MAYKSKTTLETDNTDDFTTNGNRSITAEILRGWNQDILDSLYLGEYDGTTLLYEPDTLTKTGLLVINATTGQDFNVNGTTELTIEPDLVEAQNNLGTLGYLRYGVSTFGDAGFASTYYTDSDGVVLLGRRGVTSPSTEFLLANGVGGSVFDVPTGTANTRFYGSILQDNSTEDLGIIDSGSTSATEQDWIEVTVGGNTGYIRVFATK
ncbi:MAG: hypothetical protein JXQ96_23365 [Cyclobacteriaceae bacterium]